MTTRRFALALTLAVGCGPGGAPGPGPAGSTPDASGAPAHSTPSRSEPPTVAPESAASPTIGAFTTLRPGLDLGVFDAPRPSSVGDSRITVVRVDPEQLRLVLHNASAPGEGARRSARAWADRHGLLAVINASMFLDDHRTSTHLMINGEHVNNPRTLADDNAFLVFDPEDPADPGVRIVDRTCEDVDALRGRYRVVIQGIRMTSCRRENVWAPQPKIWSHAVLGVDDAGRFLMIHARSPFSTHEFIDHLLALPIGIAGLQYAEGGPEAELFVRAGGVELERLGSYESGFNQNDDVAEAWALPNVIGVVARDP
ncbi:MAG: phosphodiester glycosidase family protein [Nannocystaceae bacterium]